MQMQLFQMPPMRVGRNDTMYALALYGSVLLFLLNIFYAALMLFYIIDHDYSVITESIAVLLMVMISFGCFVGLATLYTVTLNDEAYHKLRPVCLTLIWVYLGLITFEGGASLIYSFSSERHQKLFWLLFWPSMGEYAVYFGAFYGFYHLHSVLTPYVLVPQYPQMNIRFPMHLQY